MKLNKKTGNYYASNVMFDPIKLEAFSYSWWKFLGVIEGKLVFNNYNYSNTTIKHQYKTRELLREMGIKVDFEIPVPSGLPGTYQKPGAEPIPNTLEELILVAEEHLCDQIGLKLIKKQESQQFYKQRKIREAQELMQKTNTTTLFTLGEGT